MLQVWKNSFVRILEGEKSRKFWLIFILLTVLVSRLFIYLSFLLWREDNSLNISFWETLSRFDTTWYKSIIEEGYHMEPTIGDKYDAANWAFFPLFPFIIKTLKALLPMNCDVLAFIVNSVFFFLFLIVAVKYIVYTRNDYVQAIIFTILMAFGIGNFYFSILYTEALFILLLAVFFYCMEKKRYVLMGVAGALASATRNTGVMFVFAIAAHYLTDYFKNNNFSIKTLFGNFFGNVKLVLGTALVPLGLFLYMGYLYILTGDSLAFVHIQRAWGREISNPFGVLMNSLTNIDSFVFYLSLFAVWGIYCVWLLIWRKRWAEAVMAFLIVFIPLSTSVDSIPRYLIGSFLPLLGYTDGISKWDKSRIVALLLFSIFFGGICLWGWFNSEAFVM